METKNFLLGAAIFLIILIIAWPIYFFTLFGLNIVGASISELLTFSFFEVILIIILVLFWETYKRIFKSAN